MRDGTHSDDGLAQDARVPLGRRLLYVFGPALVTALILAIVRIAFSTRVAYEVGVSGGISLLGAGMTIVFGKATLGTNLFEFSLTTAHLAIIAFYVNAASGFFYAYNLDLMQKLPKIGPYMLEARRNAVAMLRRRRWIRRWAVVGVGMFVILPLPGSGSFGGCIVGRIIGVSKFASFTAVSVAGAVVATGYAALADQLETALDRLEQFAPPWVRVTVAALAIVLMIWLMSKLVRFFATHPEEEAPVTGG